ncbi:hypothetical protein CPB84DRAFT_1412681 [Gymnopilus junonius]|uniref:Secreted protein n=1 Tax=Gymnopilus junonius TaxID=109634 RepID=A0A9P5NK37_GYMJU|nr:hypothetical protein CPB84DRAFT_1412681 [Gymnopilus junonius]
MQRLFFNIVLIKSCTAVLVEASISAGYLCTSRRPREVNRHTISCSAPGIKRHVPTSVCRGPCSIAGSVRIVQGIYLEKACAIPAPQDPLVLQACTRMELAGAENRSPLM